MCYKNGLLVKLQLSVAFPRKSLDTGLTSCLINCIMITNYMFSDVQQMLGKA